jgi:hypothetical protein
MAGKYSSRQIKFTLKGESLKQFDTVQIERRDPTEADTARHIVATYFEYKDIIKKIRAGKLQLIEAVK